ncbi:MAG: CDP-alcohol phosphatidyltransferase family protein [Kofleriaceae bacterium]
MDLDAIVLAETPTANVRIAGLRARARAERVARRAGARVLVVSAGNRAAITAWRGTRTCPLLVIRGDQLVHTPLIAPLIAAPAAGLAIAIGPDGDYAGAAIATGDAAPRVLEALVRGDDDAAIAATADAKIPHGPIARHALETPADRRAAHQLLYQILVKPQDNAITRYLFRPISSRLSRLLIRLPITATQVSLVVAALVAVGCWLTLDPRPSMMIAGALTILGATYLDCCDGEIARVKLQASTFGAWLDTIVDELSSIAYMVCLGWHCHAYYGPSYFGDLGFDPWLAATWAGLVIYFWMLYGIYYNIIVGVGSANSQDYVSRFIVVPGTQPDSVRLAPKPPKPAVQAEGLIARALEFAPNLVRRDFIVWLAAGLAVARLPHVSFAIHIGGGVISSIVVIGDHIHLRRIRRAAVRDGKHLERARR